MQVVSKLCHVAIAPPYAHRIAGCSFCGGRIPMVCVDGDQMYTECSHCKATGPRVVKNKDISDHHNLWAALGTWGWR